MHGNPRINIDTGNPSVYINTGNVLVSFHADENWYPGKPKRPQIGSTQIIFLYSTFLLNYCIIQSFKSPRLSNQAYLVLI